MVKGVTRQVVVVKAPDQDLFEQAIFLVRSDALPERGISEDTLLQEARSAALRSRGRGADWCRALLRPALCFLAGALAVALLWVFTLL